MKLAVGDNNPSLTESLCMWAFYPSLKGCCVVLIEVDNSYSRITCMSAQVEKQVHELLSYTVDAQSAFFGGYGPRKKCMMDKKGYFPTGLVDTVCLSIRSHKFQINDLRIAPPSTYLLPRRALSEAPYATQWQALDAAICSARGCISMPTGSGKSYVIWLVAANLNLKTLVIVPSLEIKRQMSASLKDLKNVRVENIDSKALPTLTNFDCLIIDECHHAAAKTYQKLNKTAWKGIYYRFCLSASPFRNNTEETLLFKGIAGEVIFEQTYQQAVDAKQIVPVEAYYADVPNKDTGSYAYAQVYSDLVVNNEVRNTLIATQLTSLREINNSALCLVKEIRHGRILSDLTGIPFINGQDEDSRKLISKFSDGELKVVIATEAMMGEGVDSRACEYVLIAGLGKAKSAFLQKCGRGVRNFPGKKSCKVIIYKDKSHKFTLKHFNEQKKILREYYGVEAIKL